MLIISIIMFFRKKTKLLCAYSLLASSSLAIVAHDAHQRTESSLHVTQAARAPIPKPLAPVPFAPIAQSPFLDARPIQLAAGERIATRSKASPAASREQEPAPSRLYFLKVSVRINSDDGPLSFRRGTEVRLVRQQDGKLLVTRNGTDFLIEKTQVTDDRHALAKLARSSS